MERCVVFVVFKGSSRVLGGVSDEVLFYLLLPYLEEVEFLFVCGGNWRRWSWFEGMRRGLLGLRNWWSCLGNWIRLLC